jgi:sec-independent protein translocase protein TatB
MFGIGFPELLLAAGIGLVVLGPERLPVVTRKLGHWIGKAKHMVANLKQQIEDEIEIEEIKKQLHESSIIKEIQGADLGLTEIKASDSTKSDPGNWPGMPPPGS